MDAVERPPTTKGQFFCKACLVDKPVEEQSKDDPKYCLACFEFIAADQAWRIKNRELAAAADADEDGEKPRKKKDYGSSKALTKALESIEKLPIKKSKAREALERGKGMEGQDPVDAALKDAVAQTEQAAQALIEEAKAPVLLGEGPDKDYPGAVEKYNAGASLTDLVAEYGASTRGSMYSWLKTHGANMRKRAEKKAPSKFTGKDIYAMLRKPIVAGNDPVVEPKVVSRRGGIKQLAEDIKAGVWETTEYEVDQLESPPNRNWFRAGEFVGLVDRGGNILGA